MNDLYDELGNPAGQVQSAVNAWRGRGLRFGMMWFDVEPSSWEDCATNFNFLSAMVNEARAMGVNFGPRDFCFFCFSRFLLCSCFCVQVSTPTTGAGRR
jgi:hypothetical protein